MVLGHEQRQCVRCGNPLPGSSMMTSTTITKGEAEQAGWHGVDRPNGKVTVDMCLQCQIDRAELAKRAPQGGA